jgi:hypothetical protein
VPYHADAVHSFFVPAMNLPWSSLIQHPVHFQSLLQLTAELHEPAQHDIKVSQGGSTTESLPAALRLWEQPVISHIRLWGQLVISHIRLWGQPVISHIRLWGQPVISHIRLWEQPVISHIRLWEQPVISHIRLWEQPVISHIRLWEQPAISHIRLWMALPLLSSDVVCNICWFKQPQDTYS